MPIVYNNTRKKSIGRCDIFPNYYMNFTKGMGNPPKQA